MPTFASHSHAAPGAAMLSPSRWRHPPHYTCCWRPASCRLRMALGNPRCPSTQRGAPSASRSTSGPGRSPCPVPCLSATGGPLEQLLRGTTPSDHSPPRPADPDGNAAAAADNDNDNDEAEAGATATAVAADATTQPAAATGAAVAAVAPEVVAGALHIGAGAPPALLGRRQLVRSAATWLLAAALAPVVPPLPEEGRGPRAGLSGAAGPRTPLRWGAAAASQAGEEDTRPPAEEEVFACVSPEPLGDDRPGAAALPDGTRSFRSLAAAVAACPAGGVVLVAAGRYRERLLLSRPINLRAWPRGASVEVVWETSQPYESTLEITAAPSAAEASREAVSGRGGGGGEVVVEGLTVRHSSKSVANNYGIYIRGGAPRLVECDISSATGAGVGVEGASPQLLGCKIHNCARQGIAIFGGAALDLDLDPDLAAAIDPGLMYGMTGGVVQGCDVYGNALDGVLVRSGASPDLLDNLIHNNGGVGVNLQDCSGRYEHNTVYDNARGAVAVSALFELDPGDLAGSNSLKGLLRRL